MSESMAPKSWVDSTARDRRGESIHACHCIGCCRRCGMCRTSPKHTAAYCELLQKQAEERKAFFS